VDEVASGSEPVIFRLQSAITPPDRASTHRVRVLTISGKGAGTATRCRIRPRFAYSGLGKNRHGQSDAAHSKPSVASCSVCRVSPTPITAASTPPGDFFAILLTSSRRNGCAQ
jgi:hypothetical protein